MNLHQILAPLRAHARKSPGERLDVDVGALLDALVCGLRGADPSQQRHVATTLEVLAPRLYDLWDAATSLDPVPAWLAPLARRTAGEPAN